MTKCHAQNLLLLNWNDMAKAANTISKSKILSKDCGKKPILSFQVPNYIEKIKIREFGMDEKKSVVFANTLIHWVKTNPKAMTFEEFFEAEDVRESTYRLWKHQFDAVRTAHEYVKTVFSHRREMEAAQRDNKFLSDSMHLYSTPFEEYKVKEHERKKELKAAGATNINNTTCKHLPKDTDIAGELTCSDGKPMSHYVNNKYESESKPD